MRSILDLAPTFGGVKKSDGRGTLCSSYTLSNYDIRYQYMKGQKGHKEWKSKTVGVITNRVPEGEGSSIKQGYSDAISIRLDDPRVKAALVGTGLKKAKVATHSLKKAAASYAAGGTDGTPMHFTILLRGGWSTGNVLDRYFHLADDGDRKLANLLAGRQFFTKEF